MKPAPPRNLRSRIENAHGRADADCGNSLLNKRDVFRRVKVGKAMRFVGVLCNAHKRPYTAYSLMNTQYEHVVRLRRSSEQPVKILRS